MCDLISSWWKTSFAIHQFWMLPADRCVQSTQLTTAHIRNDCSLPRSSSYNITSFQFYQRLKGRVKSCLQSGFQRFASRRIFYARHDCRQFFIARQVIRLKNGSLFSRFLSELLIEMPIWLDEIHSVHAE